MLLIICSFFQSRLETSSPVPDYHLYQVVSAVLQIHPSQSSHKVNPIFTHSSPLRQNLVESPPIRLLRLRLRLGFLLLLRTTEREEGGSLLLGPALQVGPVRAASRALHVRDLGLILHFGRVDGEEVLAAGLLPVGEGSGLERGDADLAEVLPLVSVLLLLLDLSPLLLGHATGTFEFRVAAGNPQSGVEFTSGIGALGCTGNR